MHIRKLAWKFFLSCFVITTASLWIITWYSVHIYNRLYLQTTTNEVSTRAYLIERELSSHVNDSSGYMAVDSLCKQIGMNIAARITVVLSSGKVIGDSQADPDSMENHANRPEIIQAKTGIRGIQKRVSATLHQDMLYVAIPIRSDDSIKAILRLSVALDAIKDHEHLFYLRVMLVSFFTLIILGFTSFILSRKLSHPIQLIKNGAQRFAAGELDFKLVVPKGEELGELAKSLNSMATSLNDRIQTITHQHNELNAIHSAMSEGVIAVDDKERIISMNPAAKRILDVSDNIIIKRKWLHEVIRNSVLQKFLSDILSKDSLMETSLVLPNPGGDLHIHASGTKLDNGAGKPAGAVLVLNDITRLRRLENIRKEFVANVSHELRTPLTSIKGFVETIFNGDYQLPDEVTSFLKIVSNKTDRLCSIVDDILSLSSIERDHEYQEISLTDAALKPVLDEAIATCASKAREKDIVFDLSVDPALRGMINAPLLVQAITNLLDNAIKYSDNGKQVSLSVCRNNDETTISVADQGIGIPPEHLDRIFERFYRVDKARSRKLGGTGLGLSIVKSIVIAHNGRVAVQSKLGEGSTFTITLSAVTDKVRT